MTNVLSALTVLIALLGCSSELPGQYAPTAIEGATWVVFDNMPGGGVIEEHRVLSVRGDSVVEGQRYKKLYRQEYYPETFDITEARPPYRVGKPYLHALLRDDTINRKLYGRVPLTNNALTLSPDTLINDYSGEVGDSITGVYWYAPQRITRVEHADTFGRSRRIQYIDGFRYIEGIGSTYDGPLSTFPAFLVTEGYQGLIDYCRGDACSFDLVSSVRELATVDVAVYPNPAGAKISFSGLTTLGRTVTIDIYDQRGRRLHHTVTTQAETTNVNVARLPPGMYTVVLLGERARARANFVKD